MKYLWFASLKGGWSRVSNRQIQLWATIEYVTRLHFLGSDRSEKCDFQKKVLIRNMLKNLKAKILHKCLKKSLIEHKFTD